MCLQVKEVLNKMGSSMGCREEGEFEDDEGYTATLVDNKDGTFSVMANFTMTPENIGTSADPKELARLIERCSYYNEIESFSKIDLWK